MGKYYCCDSCKFKYELPLGNCIYCKNRDCYVEDKNITYNIYTEKELLKKILITLEEMKSDKEML